MNASSVCAVNSPTSLDGSRLTVLICTRDRCHKLATTLNTIVACDRPEGITCEILVVDNGSSDRTQELVEAVALKSDISIRCILEPRRGKSRALNTGIAASRGEWILFTDDDIRASSGWLTAAVDEFRADPDLAGIGGRVELFDTSAAQVTFRSSESRKLVLNDNFDPLASEIIGCNMACRRDVLALIGEFDEELGPGAKTGAVAEDIDFIYRMTLTGRRVLYTPTLLVYHDHERTSQDDVRSVQRGYARGRGAFYWKYITRCDNRIARLAFWEGRKLVSQLHQSVSAWVVIGWIVGGAVNYAVFRGRRRLHDFLRGGVREQRRKASTG